MNPVAEQTVRDLLEQAVAPLTPIAPPLDAVRARADRRRRLRLWLGAGMAAVTAAVVAVVLVVVPGEEPHQATIAAPPSVESLTAYAAAHGGKQVAGPITTATGYYGAFTVKRGVQVVRYRDAWRPDGAVITKYGPGRWVVRLSGAGAVIPGGAAFEIRYQGGDVSYFGGVLSNAGGTWRAERFKRCQVKLVSCVYPGVTQPYGHVADGRFVSMHNDCEPYCAAGHLYRVTWRWNPSEERFEVADAHRVGRWADRP
jgi:hypothetical protein